MNISVISFISFEGYKNVLKDNWRKGKLPTVVYGIYGGKLTQENLSVEHLKAVSKGGEKYFIGNTALSTIENNNIRSNLPIDMFIKKEDADRYFEQFRDINLPNLNGNNYIRLAKRQLKKLGIDFWG